MRKKAEYVDPRIRRTRQLLKEAFFKLLEKKSFDALTVQDIADEATLNRATFYTHFVDKFALVDYFIGELFEEKITLHLSGNPECKLRALILATCEFLETMQTCPTFEGGQFAPLVESKVKALIRRLLLAELKQLSGKKRNSSDLDLASTVASWAIFGAALEWSRSDHARSAKTFVEQVIPLITASLEISSGGTCGKKTAPRKPAK
ncbi:MAG: TetR/AcrR family transcriptional regulator [Chthoniobacterales bacterium]